ncbi:hypothetical protein [Neolewinella agarilytica]|uniref:hypothetical protein n=1 Tax=Neolewinella agarilytica TaxID=478744 RepID=UPI0023530A07|nr:hypothetical protein [Neolewinella agarilytica]
MNRLRSAHDATGRKWLQKKTGTGTDETRLYTGALTWTLDDNDDYILDGASTGDGRLVYDQENQEVYTEYYHKDHLGNVRLAFTDRNEDGKVELLGETSEITQQNDYYPFGLRQEGDGLVFYGEMGTNRYRYNGKEFSRGYWLV